MKTINYPSEDPVPKPLKRPGVLTFACNPGSPNLSLIKHLEEYLICNGSDPVPANLGKVARPIYTVHRTDLPQDVLTLVGQIRCYDVVLDATPGSQHGEHVSGSMRDMHQNNDKGVVYLPHLQYQASALQGKAKLYHEYILEHKKYAVQNKQKKKGAADEGKPQKKGWKQATAAQEAPAVQLTGYIEYTVVVGSCDNIRLIYDYVTPRIYLSPNHYKPWCRSVERLREICRDPKLTEAQRLEIAGQGLSAFEDRDVYGPHLLLVD